MTAKEEDILTSQNLIKKGVVLDRLLDSLIVNRKINIDDMLIGDKNAVMVACRILAYGPEYHTKVVHPETDEEFEHTFDLSECPFKELPLDEYSFDKNEFELALPVSKVKVCIKAITGHDEKVINKTIKSANKLGSTSPEVTTRLRQCIVSVNGDTDRTTINKFVENCLSKDSLYIRNELKKITPDIELTQEIEWEGEVVDIDIPMTVDFLWPQTS
tara:strand:- start:185 stop:832 length:648 start_codon:yes stop_codon:yes gene_type:complete